MMKIGMLMIAAGAMALTPAVAQRGGGNGGNAQGSTNGVGWGNGPDSTGQPGEDCVELIISGEGGVPGNAFNGNSAFGGFANGQIAGSQPQNSVNLATSSQYHTACAHQDPE